MCLPAHNSMSQCLTRGLSESTRLLMPNTHAEYKYHPVRSLTRCDCILSFQGWHCLVAACLGGLLLLGSSTLIGITLIVDSELGPWKSPPSGLSSGMRGAIGLSWFMPILYTITTPLVYSIIGQWPSYWWLAINTMDFVLFIVIEILFMMLFLLLFCTTLRKLLYLTKKHDEYHAVFQRR